MLKILSHGDLALSLMLQLLLHLNTVLAGQLECWPLAFQSLVLQSHDK